MGIGPIPFSAIDRYGSRLGLDEDEFDNFRVLIRALDGAYLDHNEERRKAKDRK